MAEQQQYPLPNPGLPFGQQAVSPVAQTNPLASLGQGIQAGGSLGLQAAQAKNQMAQAKLAQSQIMNQTLTTAHAYFDTLSKVDPDMAIDFYHQKIAPLQDAFWNQHGIAMDSTQIPASHNNVDTLKKANILTQNAVDNPSQVGASLAGMSYLNNQMNIGELTRQRLADSMKTLQEIKSSQENQSNMFQNAKNEFDKQLSNRGGGLGLQDSKVNQAAHLRTMVNQYSQIDPKTGQVTYNFPENIQGELVTGLANLVSSSSTGNVEQLKSLTPKTSQGDLAHIASYWTNQPFSSTPQKFAQQLVEQIDRQGETAQKQRDTYQSQFHASVDPSLNPKYQELLKQTTRGIRFEDYKNPPQSQFNSEADALKANLPKGTIVTINGKKARID